MSILDNYKLEWIYIDKDLKVTVLRTDMSLTDTVDVVFDNTMTKLGVYALRYVNSEKIVQVLKINVNG